MRRAPTAWPADDTVITTRQLANLLSVTPATIRRWKGAGTGPPSCGRGAQTLYRCQDVKTWAVGNVRPSKHWKGLTSDPLHELDDRGRAILAAGKRAMIGLRDEEREAVSRKMKRKLTARAHYFASADTSPGAFEHDLTTNQQGVIDAEFSDIPPSTPDGPAPQQPLVRASQPSAQPRRTGHVQPEQLMRQPQPPSHAAQLTGWSRDRQLIEELLATPPSERPAF
jgi:hypothetical protein